ncbi:tail fiber protein [Bradyrhizobium diazoefficiens]|nr:tail fiber protein [Bradyrhizobium diazoefficiens]MBR0964774.1 tail fiber protein [Bradyrhizobium diazoefficiens]MBR0978947.1 tail fiber protein [Bradyrhizobium diazoefficiens]MBR1006761.1 tail fiber protein [Bradyrhizobium diazoefficiens]MBR1014383.1 tail fiber protein [Bradyrhizobium diazoefficiens]MBR1051942.1 tail fiber protein [Bradyrhizobium diazoefficiens]
MTLYKWSQTASADATADSTINWAEGQSPASVNDSARAMMAAIAKYRDDVAGAIVTIGTSTAYAVNTYQVYQSLAQLNGQIVAFTPHATNGAVVTIDVDGLGAKPLRSAPSVELPAGTIVQGTPYVALYNNSDAAFYLAGFFNNPYNVPIGSCIDFFGTTAPNSSFVLAYGQAVSRTAYSTLFSMFGTTYGTGDGSTTFNVPDLRGRVTAGRDDMGGVAASRLTNTYFGASATALGAAGGSQSHTLTLGELPTGITATGAGSASVGTSGGLGLPAITGGWHSVGINTGASSDQGAGYNGVQSVQTISVLSGIASGITTISNNTSGNGHTIVPPTIIANKLLRII